MSIWYIEMFFLFLSISNILRNDKND